MGVRTNAFQEEPLDLQCLTMIWANMGHYAFICAPKLYNDPSNYILCLRCGLHDLSEDMIPTVVSWTHAPPRYMHALFLESCWIHNSSLQFSEKGSVSLFLSCKALPPPVQLPTFSCVFDGFFMFTIFRIDEINTSQPSSVTELWFLVCPFLLFFLLSGFFPFWTNFRATKVMPGSCLNFCQSLPGPCIPFKRFSHSEYCELCEPGSMSPINFDPHQCSSNRRFSFLATHPDLYV